MDLKALNRGEIIATCGGILLAISIFLPWYSLGNVFAHLNSCRGPNTSCTGWDGLSAFRYVFLLAAAAPVILAWVIARGHALAWPRGATRRAPTRPPWTRCERCSRPCRWTVWS